MKATIEFTLPDEKREFQIASGADRLASMIRDTGEMIRTLHKYGDCGARTGDAVIEEVRREFYDITDGIWEMIE